MLGLGQRRRSRTGPPVGVVLLYHRIAADQADPYALCVSPDHFAQHMAMLREHFAPQSIARFTTDLACSRLAPRSVAVTFDDGYTDNFDVAGPILSEHGVDATVYMITGHGGRDHELWWDELERIFLQPGTLPARLTLELEGGAIDIELGASADYSEEDAQQHLGWQIPWADVPDEQADTPTGRHRAFRAVYLKMQVMPSEQQEQTLQRLRAWAGRGTVVRDSRRLAALDGLADRIRDLPITIGAHTIDHPALPSRSPTEQLRQLLESRSALASCLFTTVHTASYPFGLYNRHTLKAANKAGFDAAFICGDKPVHAGCNRLEIPRIQVPDVPADELRDMMERALATNQPVGG